MEKDQSRYTPLKAVHRPDNPGDTPFHLIELQTGDYLTEDDIVRLGDDFSRKETARLVARQTQDTA